MRVGDVEILAGGVLHTVPFCTLPSGRKSARLVVADTAVPPRVS